MVSDITPYSYGWGLHQRWVWGSSLQVLAPQVALPFWLWFCCEGGSDDMLTWNHPSLPWSIDLGIFCVLQLPNWWSLTGIFQTYIVGARWCLIESLRLSLMSPTWRFGHGSIYLCWWFLRVHFVHCGWIFKGAMQMLSGLLIFPRGRGRAYPCVTLPDTNFRSNSGWVVAPLWFPKLSALWGWPLYPFWWLALMVIATHGQASSSFGSTGGGAGGGGGGYFTFLEFQPISHQQSTLCFYGLS